MEEIIMKDMLCNNISWMWVEPGCCLSLGVVGTILDSIPKHQKNWNNLLVVATYAV